MRLTIRTKQRAAIVCAALLAAVSLSNSSANAASTTTANLSVTATVVANCTMTTGAVAFGNYDPTVATATTAAGSLTITCTKGQTITSIALGGGNNAGTTRQMKDTGTDLLGYSLYQPTAGGGGTYSCVYTGTPTPWGNGTTFGSVFTPAGTVTPGTAPGVTYPVCGSIAPGISVPAASYTDTVVATLTF
jgi:spore coat protein U-like protein